MNNWFLHDINFSSVTSSPSSCSPSTPTPPVLVLLHLFEPDTLTVSSSLYPCFPSSCSPPPPSASLLPQLFKPTTHFDPDDSSSSSSPHPSLPSSSPLFPPPNNIVRELKSHSPQCELSEIDRLGFHLNPMIGHGGSNVLSDIGTTVDKL